MKHVITTYVEFLCSGALFLENKAPKKIKNRDITKIKVPKDAFGFQFFDSEMKDEAVSNVTKKSPIYYYGGMVYTATEVKRKFKDQKNLIENIKIRRLKKVIHCRTGNWQPFGKTDIFIEAA